MNFYIRKAVELYYQEKVMNHDYHRLVAFMETITGKRTEEEKKPDNIQSFLEQKKHREPFYKSVKHNKKPWE